MSHRGVVTTGVSPAVYSPPSEGSPTGTQPSLQEPSLPPVAQKTKSPVPTPPLPKETKFQSKTTLDPEIYNWHPASMTLDAKLLSTEFLKNLPKYVKQDSQEKLKDKKELDAKTAVKLITLDDLNAPGEYCYLAARKISQCQFKETSKELQTALADYQNPEFVFQDSVKKQKVIDVLCKHAEDKTVAKALQRLHLVRSDIKYSIEVEGRPTQNKGQRIYDFYGPPSNSYFLNKKTLEELDWLDNLSEHLTPAGQEKCKDVDTKTLTSEPWLKENLTWFDLCQKARAHYTYKMPSHAQRQFVTFSSDLPSFCKKLSWEEGYTGLTGEIFEIRTETYYTSLDQLHYALREVVSIFGTSGSYNIHISEDCKHLRKVKDAEEYGKAMINVLYGLNFLAMLEHTSKNYFTHWTRNPFESADLAILAKEFISGDFFSKNPVGVHDWNAIKLHHIAVVPGERVYKNKDVLGFEIRSSNRRKDDTTLLLSLLDNAAVFGDIFAANAWEKMNMPECPEVFLPAQSARHEEDIGYAALFAKTPQAKKLELSEQNLIIFFGRYDCRIALPLVPWEKFPYFPQKDTLAQERLNEARERAIQELMELAKENITDKLAIEAPVKKFIETLKEITAESCKEFRHKIAEMAL